MDAEHHLRMDLLTRREKSASEGIFDGACTRLVSALRAVQERLATCLPPFLLRRSTSTFRRLEDTPGYSDGEGATSFVENASASHRYLIG
jgi:hypothetical protein